MKRKLQVICVAIGFAYSAIAQPCGSGNNWLGITSDWFTASNWCSGLVPTSTTDVTILPGTPSQPVINAAGAVCHSINISSSASLTINGNNTLSVTGDWINNGTLNANNSTVSFTANTAITQTVTGNTIFFNISKPNASSTLSFGSSVTTIGNNLSISAGSMNGGTSTIIFTGNAASLQGNSTKDFYNLEIGNGAVLTQTAGTNVNINNSYKNNGTFMQTNTRTITFQTISQTLSGSGASTFGNVTIPGAITVNAGTHDFSVLGTLNVSGISAALNGGNATITFSGPNAALGSGGGAINFNNVAISGTLSNANNKSCGLAGNWTNNGSYNAGTETITFNGGSQIIAGSTSTIFNNLNIAGTADKILGNDIAVNNTLTLTSRNIDASTNARTVYAKGTVVRNGTGHIIGNLKKDVPIGLNITKVFEVGTSSYSPVTMYFSTVIAGGSLIARTDNGDDPNIAASTLDANRSVNRYWTVTNGGVDGNYDATFEFIGSDVDAGANTNNFTIGNYIGGMWTNHTVTNVDATHIQVAGLTTFGDFVIAEVACTPPSISVQPLELQSICQDETSLDLAITASGNGLSYQWYVDNDNTGFDGDPVGVNSNSFEPPTTTVGTFHYYCIVTGTCGTTASHYATVSISPLLLWYRDVDSDGFGDASNSAQACAAPFGYVSDNTDCNDEDSKVYPGAMEVCDGKDNDCNGTVDEGVTTTFYRDADGDGFGDPSNSIEACTPPLGYVNNNADCQDDDPSVFPGAPEICDAKDNNCNGSIDDGTEIIAFYRDSDGDGYGNSSGPMVQSCSAPEGYVSNHDDCDDENATVHPGAPEVCDGNDNNCNGQADEGFDSDDDGYTICEGDCNDNDASVYPGAPEICDGKDNNCNAQIDESKNKIFYLDADGDGFGHESSTIQACSAPAGYVETNGDCNDADATVHPNATEICDEKDNDCNGLVDENAKEAFYLDADGDGYGNPAISTQACIQPAQYVRNNEDCDDTKATVYPGAPERCDGLDNNCNLQVDENVGTIYYRDADGDGYGNPSVSIKACSTPTGYVTNNTDCSDNSASTHPGATEICGNGIDDNCNGQTDEGCITKVKVCAYGQSSYDNNNIGCVPGGISSATQIMLNAVDAQPGDSVLFGSKISGRFFTLKKSDIQNGYIYKLLPGRGASKALKGYATFTKTATWSNVPLSSAGTIQNELLSQTMVLFFNLQLSQQLNTLPLNTNLNIRRLAFCVIQGNLIQAKFTATGGVLKCLQTKYGNLGITVGNLYKLANEMLGNINTCNLNYADVNEAIKNVNELLNGCGIVTIPGSDNNAQTITSLQTDNSEIIDANELSGLKVSTSPNPFHDNLRFNVVSPETGQLKILIYDVNGIKRAELEQAVIKNIPATILFRNEQLRQGMLFYRVSINKKTFTGKIMQVY